MQPKNDQVATYAFLSGMYSDGYFPKAQVDKVKAILLELCGNIEQEQPPTDKDFLRLTHRATEQINQLVEEFEEHDSEIETVAREVMAADFGFIAEVYGFGSVDIEDIIEPRDW